MPSSASAVGAGVAPRLLSASQLSPTTIQLLFSEAMSAVGLTTIGNYTLTPLGGSSARSITNVVAQTAVSVVLTTNLALSLGVNAYAITASNLTDAASNIIDPVFNTVNLTVVGTSGVAASRDGGQNITLAVPVINSGGRYAIHVGLQGNANDPKAFSNVLGEGSFVRLNPGDTSVQVSKPSSGVSNGLVVTAIALDATASPSTFTSTTTIDALPRQYYSGVTSLRRLFPSRYDIGPIEPALEGAQ